MRIWMAALFCFLPSLAMSQVNTNDCSPGADNITATRVTRDIPLDARHPAPEWQTAQGVSFCSDWQGKNPDAERQTEVRLLWTSQTLYLRFECRYRELFLFDDSDASGRRDQLWDRDVAETFLQPDPSRPRYYRELEVSPNGMWVDLDIFPEGRRDLKSGLQKSVWLDWEHHTWAAELAIPIKALTDHFDPTAEWRVNFFRVEGPREPRFYAAWRATGTPEPNFHVPSAFGKLRFSY
ncbi:MAG: carbohydrate-binding family 9-like protein [Acidobacteria bacterium]|nr:carbohydrate-binding family 9-like protein [Acidobacteriota bacterium]